MLKNYSNTFLTLVLHYVKYVKNLFVNSFLYLTFNCPEKAATIYFLS